MRIGIITFHYNHNFGAVLQCYGLRKALLELGVEVDVIHYVPEEAKLKPFWRGWGIRGPDFPKSLGWRLLKLKYQRVVGRKFSDFRKKYLSLTDECSTDAEVVKVSRWYDAIITGSDQVWVFKRPDQYFLKLDDNYKGWRISYAACCGHDQQSEERKAAVKELLSRFDHISVRNNFSRNIVSQLTSKPIAVVADPTLLVDFDEVRKTRALPFSEYILLYTLSGFPEQEHRPIIEQIKRKVGDLPIVAVVALSCPRSSPVADHEIFDASPGEWLWLIANAKFVYTDSFHGVLFSLKYHRQFMAVYSEQWRSLRLLDIADRYALKNRVTSGVADAIRKIETQDVDYDLTDRLIAEQAFQSRNYLKNALVKDA